MQRCNFLLDDFLVFEVFSEVCQGVAAMHKLSPPMAHRDLKVSWPRGQVLIHASPLLTSWPLHPPILPGMPEKAENVLRNAEGRWVLCDFGSSSSRAQVYETTAEMAAEEDSIRRTTTPAYRAPEVQGAVQ